MPDGGFLSLLEVTERLQGTLLLSYVSRSRAWR